MAAIDKWWGWLQKSDSRQPRARAEKNAPWDFLNHPRRADLFFMTRFVRHLRGRPVSLNKVLAASTRTPCLPKQGVRGICAEGLYNYTRCSRHVRGGSVSLYNPSARVRGGPVLRYRGLAGSARNPCIGIQGVRASTQRACFSIQHARGTCARAMYS